MFIVRRQTIDNTDISQTVGLKNKASLGQALFVRSLMAADTGQGLAKWLCGVLWGMFFYLTSS